MATEMMIVKDNPPVSNWNIDQGYGTKKKQPNDYPVRSYNTKTEAALIVYLKLFEKDLEYLCRRHGKFEGGHFLSNYLYF